MNHCSPILLAVGMFAACGTPVASPPAGPSNAVLRNESPPVEKTAMLNLGYASQLLFVDGGRGLVVFHGELATLVDPVRHVVVDAIDLGSPTIRDRSGNPVQGATIEQGFRSAVWGWDEAATSMLGAICLGGWGDVRYGLSVWSPATEVPPSKVPGSIPNEECRALVMSPDRSLAVVAFGLTHVQLFALRPTPQPIGAPIPFKALTATISADRRTVALASDKEIALVDVATQKISPLSPAHDEWIVSLSFHPSGKALVSAGIGEAYVWQIADGSRVKLEEKALAAAYHPDGDRLVVLTRDDVRLLDAKSHELVGPSLPRGRGYGGERIELSADGKQLAVFFGSDLRVWQLEPTSGGSPDRAWFQRLRPLPIPPPRPAPAFTRDATVRGRVVSGTKPIAGAVVEMVPSSGEWPDARALPPLRTKTGRDGRFRFEKVARIDWGIGATVAGYTPGGHIVDLRDPKRDREDVIKVDPAVTIRGTVLAPDGRPAGVVEIFHPPTPGGGDSQLTLRSDARGSFTIDHLRPARNYELQARRSDGAVRTVEVAVDKPGPVTTTIRLLPVTDPKVARIQVIDQAKKPIAGARVRVEQWESFTDARGELSTEVSHAGSVSVIVWVDRASTVHESYDLTKQHGPIVVTVVTSPPLPANPPLPERCRKMQTANEQLQRCERVPRATRDAIQKELDLVIAERVQVDDAGDFACGIAHSMVHGADVCAGLDR